MPPYDYDKTQLRAVVQGVYETIVKERLGVPAARPFGSGDQRLDVRAIRAGKMTEADVSNLMGRAFAIAVSQGQQHGTLKPGSVKPTRRGETRSFERLSRGWSDADYEKSLTLARAGRASRARTDRVNPLPLVPAIPAGVMVAGKAAFWGANVGLLAWEGYKIARTKNTAQTKNPKTRVPRVGDSPPQVRGLRPVDPQRISGQFSAVSWRDDPEGFGYLLYMADSIFPRERVVLSRAGLYPDRSLQATFVRRSEGAVARSVAEAAESLQMFEPTALARIVGPASERITREAAKNSPLHRWLRSADALALFTAYPLPVNEDGSLDLPPFFAEEIRESVQNYTGSASSDEPNDALIYDTLRRAFNIRRVSSWEVTRTGINVYRTPGRPGLLESLKRVESRLAEMSRDPAIGDVAAAMAVKLRQALSKGGVEDSPHANQAAEINRAGLITVALHLAREGDLRGFRGLGLKGGKRNSLTLAEERAAAALVDILGTLSAGHNKIESRQAWLKRKIQGSARAQLAAVPDRTRENPARTAARVAVRGSVHGARSGVAAARAWLRSPKGKTFLARVTGFAAPLGLQTLFLAAAEHLTPRQADALARTIASETGVKVTRADVATALAEASGT